MLDNTAAHLNNTQQSPHYLYPWLIWFLASSFLFYKYILEISPSVMVPELMHDFNLNGVQIGNITAFYFYTYLIMQIPAGLLLDYFSPRKLISFSIVLCAIGTILFAKAPDILIADLSRLLIGIGASFAAVGPMKLISNWFMPKQFGLIAGLMITIGILGAVGGQAPIAAAIYHWGWRTTMLTDGVIGFLLGAIFWLIVNDKPNAHTPPKPDSFIKTMLSIISQKQSWLISLYSGLVFTPISAFAGLWGIPYLETLYKLNATTVAALMSLVFIGFAIGSPLSGGLSDRLKRRKPFLFIGAALPLLLSIIIIYQTLSLLILAILLGLFGLFTGFFFVSFAAIREINKPSSTGTAIGFINTFNALGGAIATPVIGKLLDLKWQGYFNHGTRVFSIQNYHYALGILPLCLLIAMILVFAIKETYQS